MESGRPFFLRMKIFTDLALANSYNSAVQKFEANCCFFCSDPVDGKEATCTLCGSIVCVGSVAGGAGCISADSLTPLFRSRFECPTCILVRKKVETKVIPYIIAGGALRRTPKMNWPLLLIGLELSQINSLAIRILELRINSSYTCNKKNVRPVIIFSSFCYLFFNEPSLN